MKNHIKADPWKIIEEGFSAALHPVSESIFSIGNGKMGQRANFEEKYSGETLRSRKQLAQSAPDLKNGFRHTQISDDGQTIHQTLIDPDDLNDWSLHLTLDLEKSNDARTRPPPRIYRPDLRTHDLTFVVPRHRQNFALEPRQHSTYLPPNFDEAKRLPQQDRDSPLDEVIKDFARRLRPGGPDGEIHG